MALIPLSTALAGILGLFAFSPETAKPLRELAEVLLRSERNNSTLTPGQRELIAAYVSSLNKCQFCCNSHSAAAGHYLHASLTEIQKIVQEQDSSLLDTKMKALFNIAHNVQEGGRRVTFQLAQEARNAGATDTDIHDTVLIAAAFCMYNRYVDGLLTESSPYPEEYLLMGESMACNGYVTI